MDVGGGGGGGGGGPLVEVTEGQGGKLVKLLSPLRPRIQPLVKMLRDATTKKDASLLR